MHTQAHHTFTTVLQPALASMRGLAAHWTRGVADAEDAMQETAIRLLRFADRFDPDQANAEAWVATVLRNECARLARSRGRELARTKSVDMQAFDLIEHAGPETYEFESERRAQASERARLHNAIAELPDVFRDALLDQAAGLSCQASAALRGVGINTIHGRRSRARIRVRESIAA